MTKNVISRNFSTAQIFLRSRETQKYVAKSLSSTSYDDNKDVISELSASFSWPLALRLLNGES